MKRIKNPTHPLFILTILITLACPKNQTEQLQEVENLIEQGQTAAAQTQIQTLLADEAAEYAQTLSPIPKPRILKRSLDGNMIAWLENQTLYHYGLTRETDTDTDEFQTQELPLDLAADEKITALNLSYTGKYALLLLQKNKTCQTLALDLQQNTPFPKRRTVSCLHRPAITDAGPHIFYIEQGTLQRAVLNSDESSEIAPKKTFKPRYSKINNRFELLSVQQQGLFIFHGAAGYYNLYFYSGTEKKIKLIKKACAKPILFGAFPNEIMETTQNKPKQPLFSDLPRPQALVYGGAAGTYQLYGLQWEPKLKFSKGVATPPASQLVYLPAEKQLLLLLKQQLCLWDWKGKQCSKLPLEATHFEFFAQGFVYTNLQNKLFLRKTPFTDHERNLLKLMTKINSFDKTTQVDKSRSQH